MSCSPATNTRCCAGPRSSWASRAAHGCGNGCTRSSAAPMRTSSPRSRTRASATTRRCSSRSSRRRRWKMTFQKKEEPLPIRGRRHHPERSSTLMRFPMRSDGYIHGHPHGHVYGHPHGYVHGHPHGDAHQIEGKQARRFMYMNRTQHLPRPSAQEQQPECRRPE